MLLLCNDKKPPEVMCGDTCPRDGRKRLYLQLWYVIKQWGSDLGNLSVQLTNSL